MNNLTLCNCYLCFVGNYASGVRGFFSVLLPRPRCRYGIYLELCRTRARLAAIRGGNEIGERY